MCELCRPPCRPRRAHAQAGKQLTSQHLNGLNLALPSGPEPAVKPKPLERRKEVTLKRTIVCALSLVALSGSRIQGNCDCGEMFGDAFRRTCGAPGRPSGASLFCGRFSYPRHSFTQTLRTTIAGQDARARPRGSPNRFHEASFWAQ